MLWRQHGLVSQKQIDRRQRRRRIALFLFGLIIFLCIATLFWIGYSQTFRINKITFSGITTAKETLVNQIVAERLDKKILFVFPIDNTVLVPKEGLKDVLLESFTQIEDVETTLTDAHTIDIKIKERKPIGVWCENTKEMEAEEIVTEKVVVTEKCFFLDKFGYIFSRAPDFSGNLFFKYYGGDISTTTIGSYYLPTDIFTKRVFFITSLSTLGLNPISSTWNINGDSYIHLSPKKDVGLRGDVLFNNDDDLSIVFEHLSLTITHEDFAELGVRIIDVEYIDLRSPNKIFYKLK